MPLVIDTVRSASDLTQAPRITQNLVPSDLSEWSSTFIDGSGISGVVSGSNNNTFTASKGSGAARVFIGYTFAFEAGKTYAYGATFKNRVGSTTIEDPNFAAYPSVSAGSTYRTVGASPDGRYAVTFTSSETANKILRIGFGSRFNGEDGVAVSEEISDVFVYEIETITSPIPSHAPMSSVKAELNEALNSMDQATGLITEGDLTATPLPNVLENKVGLFIGDSFCNGTTEWPVKLCQFDGNMVMIGDGNPGSDTVFFETHIDDLLALTDYSLEGIQPTFVILQASVNNPNVGRTAQETVDSMTNLINKVKAAGLVPIITNIAPEGQASAFSPTELINISDTNVALATMATALNVQMADIFSALVDVDGVSMQTAYYLVGDEVHPSEAGSQVIAETIHAEILNIVTELPLYTVCSLTVSNSYQSTQFQASTVCPLGRDWGTKRYTVDGVIIPNYIHDD